MALSLSKSVRYPVSFCNREINLAQSLLEAITGDVTFTSAGVASIAAGSIVNADVKSDAAIAYSKLNLATSILNADISASAAIATSKLALATAGIVFGAGTPTSIIDASGLTSATNAIKFADTKGATVGAMTLKNPATDAPAGKVTILVGSTTYEIPFYAVA